MRRGNLIPALLLATAAGLASEQAAAHAGGAHAGGFMAGLGHPLVGADHLLAMLAVGLWAAQLGGRAAWQVPAAFVAALALGAGAAVLGLGMPAVEPGIMVSMLVMGLLVAFAVRLPAAAGMAVAAVFALSHGHAHGTELPVAASPLLYGLGFVLASVGLHLAGVTLGALASRFLSPLVTRAAGAMVAAAGVWALTLAI